MLKKHLFSVMTLNQHYDVNVEETLIQHHNVDGDGVVRSGDGHG